MPKPIVSRSYDLRGNEVEDEVVVRIPEADWLALVGAQEQFEALVHAARKLKAEDEAWVFANRGREEAFYAAVEDVIAALPESNPAINPDVSERAASEGGHPAETGQNDPVGSRSETSDPAKDA